MSRRHILTRAIMEAGIARGLSVADLAIECSVCTGAVYRACRRFKLLMTGQDAFRAKPYRRVRMPVPPYCASVDAVECFDCAATVLPARGERMPVRCSACVARRSLALIALNKANWCGQTVPPNTGEKRYV
jgi:hypothetical protein